MANNDEIWKPILGYEGYYEVSNLGRVKSLPRETSFGKQRQIHKGGILKQHHQNSGYLFVNLSLHNKKKQTTVHRLVAEHFLENPFGYREVNHKDDNKDNNRVENLEWCEHGYNMNYGGVRSKISKANSKPVEGYDEEGNVIQTFDSATKAAETIGLKSKSSIATAICYNVRMKGLHWRYANQPN